jgi:broad specificity phosphatase PhoE
VQRGWIDVHGVRRWMEAYNAAEISPDHPPPPHLEATAASASRIITSDLPRTVASARRLAPGREHDIERTALLREAPLETPELPFPSLGGIRLPFHGWGLVFLVRFVAAVLRGAPPPGVDATVLARAEEAADWLAEQAAASEGHVVVVTHATFRLLVARALVRRGWRGPERRRYHEWSAWHYAPPLSPAARR